jgi:hypothetical protein
LTTTVFMKMLYNIAEILSMHLWTERKGGHKVGLVLATVPNWRFGSGYGLEPNWNCGNVFYHIKKTEPHRTRSFLAGSTISDTQYFGCN